MKDYIDVIFSNKPFTSYPILLTRYLFDICSMEEDMSFLEIGTGRAEQLKEFNNLGLNVLGMDSSPNAQDFAGNLKIIHGDANETLPFDDGSFDLLYNKSLIGHLRNPSFFISETYRVLKPGGKLISLVPDWESQYKKMYDDYTLIKPFTVQSLYDIQLGAGYDVKFVKHFRQLPIVWKYPMLNIPMNIMAPLIPVRVKNNFLRWVKELMLLSLSQKL